MQQYHVNLTILALASNDHFYIVIWIEHESPTEYHSAVRFSNGGKRS